MRCHTLHALFEAHVVQFPMHIAAIHNHQMITYAELNQQANQLAHYLQHLGVKPEQPIAVCLDRSIELLVTLWGILKAGGAFLPLDSTHPPTRLSLILTDSRASLLITKKTFEKKFNTFQGTMIALDKSKRDIAKQSTLNVHALISEKNLAYMLYTSGSTGQPKGVLIEHASLVHYTLWFKESSNCRFQQRIDFSINYIFDAALSTCIVPLALGLTVVICDDVIKHNLSAYLNYINLYAIQIIKMTPSYFKLLFTEVKTHPIKLACLEQIFLGGELLQTKSCSDWLSIYPHHRLVNEYGPTETTIGVLHYDVDNTTADAHAIHVPIGYIKDHSVVSKGISDTLSKVERCSFYLLDNTGKPVPDGTIGELYIGGASLARGYLNQPELTKTHFIQNPFSSFSNDRLYKTGDLCRCFPNGALECVGRCDHQIKLRGVRIELGEIEHCLMLHPAIKDAVVLVHPDKTLMAYYIPEDPHAHLSYPQVFQHLNTHLPHEMIPTNIIKMQTFPLNTNGKLDHPAFPVTAVISKHLYSAPRTRLEKMLVQIWSEEFEIETIGRDDHFFALGGNSLVATRIIAKIQTILGRQLTLNELYQTPTIALLAKRINRFKPFKRIAKKISNNHVPHNTYARLPLSDFQFLLWISYLFEPKVKKLNTISRRRMTGQLDIDTLHLAFNALFKHQEILCYRVGKWSVSQSLQKNISFAISVQHISSLSNTKREKLLCDSMLELLDVYPWRKNFPLLIARVFFLESNCYELQICMSHHVCDDASIEILFNTLSRYYLHLGGLYHPERSKGSLEPQFKDYITQEQPFINHPLERDIHYWDKYLSDAYLLSVPTEFIVADMQKKHIPYSTYLKIPANLLQHLRQICTENAVSMNEILCASLGIALKTCCGSNFDATQKLLMNVVKSTRNDPTFDNTIGCFLSIDPIKLDLSNRPSLTDLAQQVQRSMLQNEPYQKCSTIIKLGSINKLYCKKSWFKPFAISTFTYLYKAFNIKPSLNSSLFPFFKRMATFDRTRGFIINVNVWRNFLEVDRPQQTQHLFGAPLTPINFQSLEISKMDYILDVCFLKEEGTAVSYIVLSGNILPQFREDIAKEMIHILSSIYTQHQ